MAERYGGIYLVTGKLGHGKSLFAVRKVAQALLDGQIVATNIVLVDDWNEQLARKEPKAWFSKRWREARARQLLANYHYVRDVAELQRIRIEVCGRCDRCKRVAAAGGKRARSAFLMSRTSGWTTGRGTSARRAPLPVTLCCSVKL